jgi:hypothetical protein
MSIVSAILFNAPPPVFNGTARAHFIDNEPPKNKNYRMNAYVNRLNADQRYRDALIQLGGRGTSRQIADAVQTEHNSAIRFIRKRKDVLFRHVGYVENPSKGRDALVWEWIGD